MRTPPPPTPPPPPPPPVVARILKTEVAPDGDMLITNGAGSESDVGKASKSRSLLRGTTDAKLSGGTVTIIRVDKRTTTAKVKATSNVVNANPTVILEP